MAAEQGVPEDDEDDEPAEEERDGDPDQEVDWVDPERTDADPEQHARPDQQQDGPGEAADGLVEAIEPEEAERGGRNIALMAVTRNVRTYQALNAPPGVWGVCAGGGRKLKSNSR